MTVILDLSNRICNISNNILRTLTEKAENIQKYIGNISEVIEILRNNPKEILQIKNYYNRGMTLMRSSVDSIQPKKEFISLKTCQ